MLMWLDWHACACKMARAQEHSPGSGACSLPCAGEQLNPIT